MEYSLSALIAAIAVLSLWLSRNAVQENGFFEGKDQQGASPSLLTLTLSQVTTWIFARSLMNAAILGFYYGIWGTLAYAAYYLSFFTGAKIIDHLRFHNGFNSIQAFLSNRFGEWGMRCYNFVVGIRLVSEVFANLLVIGILFGVAGSQAYTLSIIAVAIITLCYSMMGGLQASLKTDVLQMSVFIAVLAVLMGSVLFDGYLNTESLFSVAFDIQSPGPVLLMVALLQVWSYPMHDPVMMDRGFLSDREVTKRSFMHAGWISMLCIMLFGLLGVMAGFYRVEDQSMNQVLAELLGPIATFCFSATLILSAMSTLDSTLSSSAKLLIVNMNKFTPTVTNGRWAMAGFMGLGLLMVFLGNKDLFSAVAVSGTASLYLFPVIIFSLWGNKTQVPLWSYLLSFFAAMLGAALYFTESSGYTTLLGGAHKYTKLLWISLFVMIIGSLAFWVGLKSKSLMQPMTSEASPS
jgi:Na+/proline symporter